MGEKVVLFDTYMYVYIPVIQNERYRASIFAWNGV